MPTLVTMTYYDQVKQDLFSPWAHRFFSFEVEGEEHLPAEGGYIIAPNHIRWYDPILLAVWLPKQVSFAAKIELFKSRIPRIRQLMVETGHIPLDRKIAHRRDIQRGLADAAKKKLDEGIVFGIFPEGTRARGKRLLPFKRGVVMIAAQTGYPIVPIGISYHWHWLRRKVRIVFGEPICGSGLNSRELTRELERRVTELSGRQLPLESSAR